MLTISAPITAQEYLRAERKSETKNEFINGEIIPLSGASLPHNIISNKIAAILTNSLDEDLFTVCQSDMRVHNAVTGSYTYPDVVVISGEPQLLDDEFDNLLNPALIVEVLSPGTEGYDRGDKAHVYRHLLSLKEYVIVSQIEALVEHWTRLDENKWQLEEFQGMDKLVRLLGGQCDVKLSDVYRKVKLKK